MEDILALTAWLARELGDTELESACAGHVRAVYGLPDSWSARRRAAMANRLGGGQLEWLQRNAQAMADQGFPAGEIGYRHAQLGELAYLALWDGSPEWPAERIRREFAEQSEHLRARKKLP